MALLDYPAYFDLLKLPLPVDQPGILARLEDDALLVRNAAGGWDVTNLGAILFAKDLHRFRGLARKAARVVVYEGKGRTGTIREQEGRKGYAAGFQGLIDYLDALLPRNEVMGSALRRVGICEERGSGIDKVVFQTEVFQLPAPSFETPDGSTRAVLFAHRAFREMDRNDRIRACYLHACLRHVERNPMTNGSLRERFGIEAENSAMVSRIIKETIGAKLIRPYDPDQGKRHAKYVPFWA